MHSINLLKPATAILAERAQLMTEIARLETAGMDTARAFKILAQYSPQKAALMSVSIKTGAGTPVWKALASSQLFSDSDIDLIQAMENTGDLQPVYAYLGKQYSRQWQRLRRVKTRLYLPFAVLLIGQIAANLPLLVQDEIGVSGFLFRALTPVLIILLSLRLMTQSFIRQDGILLSSLVFTVVPLLQRRIYRVGLHRVLSSLSMLLAAGLPASEAVLIAGNSITASIETAEKCRLISQQLATGQSLAKSFDHYQLLNDPHLSALIHTGEAAGELPAMLARCAEQIQQSLDYQAAVVAEWLPGLIYLLVLGWLAHFLF